MTIVVCEPEKTAYKMEIDGTLEAMQKIVGGYIEPICLKDDFAIICDEDGKVTGKKPNRCLYDKDTYENGSSDIIDVISGTFFVCKCGGEDFISLTDKEAERFLERFKYAEYFIPFQ